MRDFTEFKRDLDSYLYTQRELDILYGAAKNVSSSQILKLFDKTVDLDDPINTLRLLGYNE